MEILICGAGALGSNLASSLLPDLRGEHKLTILDFDRVEKRNIQAGTQIFFPEQLGRKKTDSLQYNLYKLYQKKVEIITDILSNQNIELLKEFDLVIDALDNHNARKLVQDFVVKNGIDCLHCGFSSQMTFEICWAENYEVPSDDTSDFDVCTIEEASSFIKLASSLSAITVLEFLKNGKKLNFIGNKFTVRQVK